MPVYRTRVEVDAKMLFAVDSGDPGGPCRVKDQG